MNAAKAKKNPAKVKGAVLIMILAVMTVLIILLAGSIAVVYSAHNRAYVKYTESQGYYTARSILDNFFTELAESTDVTDSTGANVGTYYKLDLENTTTVAKPLCMGRSIELELYKTKVDVKDSTGAYLDWFTEYCDENSAGLGSQINGFEGTTVDYTSPSNANALYSKVEKYYVNLSQSDLSDFSTYQNFYKQYLPVSTVAAGMSADTIIYEIPSLDGFGVGTIDTNGDGTPDTNSNYGKLSDSGASKAWLTVQVTERILAMGEGTSYADRFKAGKRTEDHIVAKVTAHVIFDGEEITTTRIWYNNPPPVVDTDTGLAALGGIDTTTSVSAIGDIASLAVGYSELTNDSTYSGNIYFEGTFGTGSVTPKITMTEDDAFFAGDHLVINTNTPDPSLLCDGALFYASTAYLRSSGASFGTSDHRINLVTKQFESHTNAKEFYGNIYAERFDVNTDDYTEISASAVRGAAETSGVAFSSPPKKIYGNVYCNYLGIPSYCVYVDVGVDTVTFKVNCDPVTGEEIPESDNRRIENMLADSSYKIVVYDGISLISGTKKETIGPAASLGGHNSGSVDLYLNEHETYYVTVEGVSVPCDIFADYRTTGIGEMGDKVNSFKTESDRSFVPKGDGSALTASEYKVMIDWDHVNPSVIEVKTASADKLNVDYYADKGSGDWTLNDKFQKEFKLPSGVTLVGSGDNTFTLPTHKSIYGSYFYGSIIGGTTGAAYPYTFDADTGMFTVDPDNDAIFQTFLSEHSIDTEAILAGIDTEGPVDIDNLPSLTNATSEVVVGSGGGDTVNGVYMPAYSNVISSSGYIAANGNCGTTYYIDARTSDLEIQLGDGTNSYQKFTGTYVVYGDNHVTVTVPGVIGGGIGQTVEIGDGGHPFFFMTEEIYSGKSKNEIVIGEPDSRSTLGSDVTTAPNIDWYVSSDVNTIKIYTGGGGDTALCGYIVAPSTHVDISSSVNGNKRTTYYYKQLIPSGSGNDKYTVFGSIFCASYVGGQHCGVCYIPRDDGYIDDGSKPLLNKTGMYASRR